MTTCVHCGFEQHRHSQYDDNSKLLYACPIVSEHSGAFIGWHPTNRFTPRSEPDEVMQKLDAKMAPRIAALRASERLDETDMTLRVTGPSSEEQVMSENFKTDKFEEARNVKLAAPARFFAEVDSVLSLLVHRHGRGLPDDVKQDSTRLYYEARKVYGGGIPTTVEEVAQLEREMEFKKCLRELIDAMAEVAENIAASPGGQDSDDEYGLEYKHFCKARHIAETYGDLF